MTEVKLDDGGLRFDSQDFKVFSGDPKRLAPGERLVFAATKKIELGDSLRPRVRAIPVDTANAAVRGDVKVDFDEFRFTIARDDSLPGFFDALRGGWRTLLRVGSVVLIVVGALLPFFWVPLVIGFGLRWWRRRHPKRERTAPQPWQPANLPQQPSAGMTPPTNPVNLASAQPNAESAAAPGGAEPGS